MAILSIDIQCADCGGVSILVVDKEARNDQQVCPDCGGTAERIFASIQTRTEKTSTSFVDGTTNRFDGVRLSEKLKRARKKAKASGDREVEKSVRKEIKDRGVKI